MPGFRSAYSAAAPPLPGGDYSAPAAQVNAGGGKPSRIRGGKRSRVGVTSSWRIATERRMQPCRPPPPGRAEHGLRHLWHARQLPS